MKTKQLTTLVMTCLLMVGALAFVATTTKAEQHTIDANVTIVTPVSVLGVGALNFALLSASTNGSCNDWTIAADNGGTMLQGGGGNGVDFLSGDHSQGTFTITGSTVDAENVTYSVEVTTPFADASLTLLTADLTMFPDSPQLLNSPLSVNIGGILTVCPDAAAVVHTATITMTANYVL